MKNDDNLNEQQKKQLSVDVERFSLILQLFLLQDTNNNFLKEENKKLRAENEQLKKTQSPVFIFGKN